MPSNITVIELNGRRYNALTGVPLDSAPKSLDGFRASPAAEPTPAPVHHPDVARAGQHHAARHPVQHSHTLMRQAVHHPTDGFKRHAHTASNTGSLVKQPRAQVATKHAVVSVDPDRLRRAGQAVKSDYIRRFATGPQRHAFEAAPVQAVVRQAVPAPEIRPVVAPRQPSDDIFERALAAANSHEESYAPAPKRHRNKGKIARVVLSVSASLTAVALIIGFVAYQNAALIQLKLASAHAGMNATLPIWQPSGFSLGSFNYSHSNVAITYSNARTGQTYTISQSPTNWSASDLLNTYVYPNNETYDTLSSGGTTIYTYGNNDATWVRGGVWYKLISSGSLSNSQIVNIATSMRS